MANEANVKQVKIKILGEEYSFYSSSSREALQGFAKELGESFYQLQESAPAYSKEQVLSLLALGLIEDATNALKAKHAAEEAKSKAEEALAKANATDAESFSASMMTSAESEFEQIAKFRDEENELLRSKLAEYESEIEAFDERSRIEISKLRDEYESGKQEFEQLAQEKIKDNETLRNTLLKYEMSYNTTFKQKEAEIQTIRSQLEEAYRKIRDLEKAASMLPTN
ncbi:MAG: hypothetical protein LBN40_00230 [Oscillospiraceae bacterium]|jgi:cell division protein ZapA (FtsZ GTPase activity inhibitor)|nr:hypothetical protein [Oscillospiraceae bacterium]